MGTQLLGQALSALGKPYDWGTASPWDPEWFMDVRLGSEVLNDDLSIRLRKTKPEFFALFFERKMVVHFATEEDIIRHAGVVLPESLDPPYDDMYVAWDQRSEASRPRWLNTRLDHFVARRIHWDGTWEELPVKAVLEEEELLTLRTYETVWNYVLDVQGIAPGDVIEFRWKYMIPYDYNWPHSTGWRSLEWMDNWARLTSWRMFFHGDLPIRKQRVEVLFHVLHGLELGGAKPDERTIEGRMIRCVWHKQDLPGCMAEVNARPATDLPHIVMQLVPEDFRYWRSDRLTGLPFPQPYWLQVIRYRESRAVWWWRIGRKNLPDKQTALIKAFIKRTGGSDTSAALRMERIHDHISQRFSYEKDELWYMDKDLSLQRLGQQVTEERIRDNSRYDLYSRLLNTQSLEHVTAYLLDSRVGSMSDEYFTSMWDNEYLFGVRHDREVLWMHPKRQRIGLLTNELPFYWQGTRALVSDLGLLLEDIPPAPVFVVLPEQGPAWNLRAVEHTMDVDLDRRSMQGDVKVLLSGQFSTLGRAAYFGAAIDSTVDPLYGWRPTDPYGVTSYSYSPGELSTDPPFRFRTAVQVQLDGQVSLGADNTYTIDLAPFIAHAVPSTFGAEGRTLPFHWDFAQLDRFSVELRFAQDVEILDTGPLILQETSHGASLNRRVELRSGSVFFFESELHVSEPVEEEASFTGLERLLSAASADHLVIRVRKLGIGR